MIISNSKAIPPAAAAPAMISIPMPPSSPEVHNNHIATYTYTHMH